MRNIMVFASSIDEIHNCLNEVDKIKIIIWNYKYHKQFESVPWTVRFSSSYTKTCVANHTKYKIMAKNAKFKEIHIINISDEFLKLLLLSVLLNIAIWNPATGISTIKAMDRKTIVILI